MNNNDFSNNECIYWDFIENDPPESLWRDFQRWRETLGILVLTELPIEPNADLSKAMEDFKIAQKFEEICEENKLVLNTYLIVIPTSNQIDTQGWETEFTHFVFSNKNNEFDLEKPLFNFLNTILAKIEIEAANFADNKNEGLIITLADINIDEGFTTLK